jgi:hypothetical protein
MAMVVIAAEQTFGQTSAASAGPCIKSEDGKGNFVRR